MFHSPGLLVGQWNLDLPVQATGTQQGGIQGVRPVSMYKQSIKLNLKYIRI